MFLILMAIGAIAIVLVLRLRRVYNDPYSRFGSKGKTAPGDRFPATHKLLCEQGVHQFDDRCRCVVCGYEEHAPGKDCRCMDCGAEVHEYHNNVCLRCGQCAHLWYRGKCMLCGAQADSSETAAPGDAARANTPEQNGG